MTRIGAGLSTAEQASDAGGEAAAAARAELRGADVDLAFLFLSPHHLDEAEEAAGQVREELAPAHLAGCVAEGVIGRERELEGKAGVAVWAASLPGAVIEPFHVQSAEGDDGAALRSLPDLDDPALVIVLADPFQLPVPALVERFNEDYPGVPLVGGIATGAGRPGAQALVLDGEIHRDGAIGIGLSQIAVEAVVSQGCAPLGPDAVVTRAAGNVVFELAGRPALERLREVVASLSPQERLLATQGLLAGLVIDENRPEYGRGDFLMRGILGADEESGAIAVGEEVRVGQTLRFHARDAASADADLRLALEETLAGEPRRAAGALLFSCNGRGQNMFDGPDHDSGALVEALGGPTLAGFFCGGEIGPVGGRSFLHGFTATMAIFLDDGRGARRRPA
jgi:small ligand-binding sensory domain FIST